MKIKSLIFCALIMGLGVMGCTPSQYAKWADKSAYRTLAEGEKSALGDVEKFDVSYKPFGQNAKGEFIPIKIGKKTLSTDPNAKLAILTLDEALEVAFRNSREFQNRREDLYADALNLANTRRGWDYPLFSGDIDADAEWENVRNTGESKFATATVNPTLTQRFVSGGVLTLATTVDWLTESILGTRRNIASSFIQANFTQPLIRGAWRGIAYEEQYRLERNFLFSVFAFDRYRQTFAVDIYAQYFAVLQSRDQLNNEEANIKRLERTFAVTKALADHGMVSKIEEYQAESDLLSAQVANQRNIQTHENLLDEFKITLGLPITVQIDVDYPNALHKLAKQGLIPLKLDEDQAVKIALAVRPDVLTQRAAVRDAERDIVIAADQFNPQLDVEIGMDIPSTPERKFARLEFHNRTRYAALTFNYELDQIDNRDVYRLTIIAFQRACRDLQQFLDEVRLDVRESHRELIQSRKSYEIQKRNVHIAQSRSTLASLQQKSGVASARDVLEAEESLLNAQNSLTNALISYNTTRLRFLATLGMISVDKKGIILETNKPFRFTLIQEQYPYVGEK